MHSCLKVPLIVLFTLSQAFTGSRFALAQDTGSVDVEPPLIEHEVIDEAEADIRQTFVATVVDDEELDSVLFYYRYAGETSFSRYVMMQVSSSSTYIAQLPTEPTNYRAIEYYIQARDTSGNRTVRGYTFNPLVRQIVPATGASPDADRIAESTDEIGGVSEDRGLPKAVYIVGGVLLLGLIASAAGGGSDGEGRECGPDGCRLTLTVNQPY